MTHIMTHSTRPIFRHMGGGSRNHGVGRVPLWTLSMLTLINDLPANEIFTSSHVVNIIAVPIISGNVYIYMI